MRELSLILLVSILSLSCQVNRRSKDLDRFVPDLTIYKYGTIGAKDYFASKNDTIYFSSLKNSTSINDSKLFTIEVDSIVYYIDASVKLAYSIEDSAKGNSEATFLNLPYGQFHINKGKYTDKTIECTVVINNQLNKEEKKITNRDWNKAEKRREESIHTLVIKDIKSGIIYASASRLVSSTGEIMYSININESCPKQSVALFKSGLFMILWIYQDKQVD